MNDQRRSSRILMFGGWQGFVLLLLCIVVLEALPVFIGGDWGGLLWTTSHFIINPVLCLVYILVTVFKGIHARAATRILYLVGVLIAAGYVYIAISGNILWVQLLGIKFR